MTAFNVEVAFPGLTGTSYQVTSPVDHGYNCIAWAAGDNTRFWWPSEIGGYYWPDDCPRTATLGAFETAFGLEGFEACDDSGLEPGWERVAIYVKPDGTPTHAARQLQDGRWASKLGRNVDIEHVEPDHVAGAQYGAVALYMKRPIVPADGVDPAEA